MDENLAHLPALEDIVKGPLETEAETGISRAIREDEKESTELIYNGPRLMPKASLTESDLFDEKTLSSPEQSHNAIQESPKEVKFTSPYTNSLPTGISSTKLGDLEPQDPSPLSTNDPIDPTTSTPKLKDFARRLYLMEKATRRTRNETMDKKYLVMQRDSLDPRTAMIYDEQAQQRVISLHETKQNAPKLRGKVHEINVKEMSTRQSKTRIPTDLNGSLQNIEDDHQALYDPESLKPEDTIYSSGDGQNKIDMKLPIRNETETCYRHYCRPCFVLTNFLTVQRTSIMRRVKVFFSVVVPLLTLSVLLFYLADNPLTKRGPSYSWCLLFAIRQMITFSLAQ